MTNVNPYDNNHSRVLQLLDMLEQTPDDCFLLHALALEQIKRNNLVEAENLFTKVIAIDHNYIGSYYHLGKVQEAKGKNAKAIATYQEGIKIAQMIRDFHSLNELRAALDDLMDSDE